MSNENVYIPNFILQDYKCISLNITFIKEKNYIKLCKKSLIRPLPTCSVL